MSNVDDVDTDARGSLVTLVLSLQVFPQLNRVHCDVCITAGCLALHQHARVNADTTLDIFGEEHQVWRDQKYIRCLIVHHVLILSPLNGRRWVTRVHWEKCFLLKQGAPSNINLWHLNILDNSWQNKFLNYISIDCTKSYVIHFEALRITDFDEIFAWVWWLWQRVNMIDFTSTWHENHLRILAGKFFSN